MPCSLWFILSSNSGEPDLLLLSLSKRLRSLSAELRFDLGRAVNSMRTGKLSA